MGISICRSSKITDSARISPEESACLGTPKFTACPGHMAVSNNAEIIVISSKYKFHINIWTNDSKSRLQKLPKEPLLLEPWWGSLLYILIY